MKQTSAGFVDEIKISELDSLRVLNNNVLIRVDVIPDDGYTLESGIIVAGSEWNEAGHVARYGEVVRIPDKLKFQDEYSFDGVMPWRTEIEIEVGDTVYFGKMASANSPVLIHEGSVYYVINYQELILAKRGEEIIPLNGYAIVEKVVKGYKVDGLIVDFGDYQDKRLGVVKYVGTPNSCYFGSDAVDANIRIGDEVIFTGGYWTELEYEVFASLDENLGYVQRCWIIGKL